MTSTTKRYYTLGGTQVAVRDSAGGGSLNYLLGDQLGSTTTSVNASTGATQTQRFLPYGAPRSGSIAATDRGWIGQTKDNSTGLQYLNARYYDPTIGRFTATDPLADLGRPSTLDAYGYAGGSPVTMSDPSGLLMMVGSGGKGDHTYGAAYAPSGRIVGGNPSGRPRTGLIDERDLDRRLPERHRGLRSPLDPAADDPVSTFRGTTLTAAEGGICDSISAAALCNTTENIAKLVQELHRLAPDRGRTNASQHMMWAALLTVELGPEQARLMLDAHENISAGKALGTLDAARRMDLINNELGVEIGTQIVSGFNRGDYVDVDNGRFLLHPEEGWVQNEVVLRVNATLDTRAVWLMADPDVAPG